MENASFAKFDEVSIQKEALVLPEDCRADYIWLKAFIRDTCLRDLDAFCEKAKRLGIDTDKTTWSKIVRGRLTLASNGEPLKNPVISFESFRASIESLRSGIRAEALRGRVPFVETSVACDIMDYISLKRSPDRINKFGIVVGETGSGKTATFKEFARRFNHGTTHWLEAPESGHPGEFVRMLAVSYGMSAKASSVTQKAFLFRAVKETHCIIVDNTQDLYRADKAEQPAFSFLRRLQDQVGNTIILSITPSFDKKLVAGMMTGYFEQFEGRSGGQGTWLRLPEYPPQGDVILFAEAFGLKTAQSHAKELVKISRQRGRVRRLFEVLQDAKRDASAARRDITIEDIISASEG